MEDRLTSSPYEILVKILASNKLSYRDAVRCSVLCKKWKNIYTELPCLYFTEDEICPEKLKQTMQEALSLHRMKVEAFRLDVKSPNWTWYQCLQNPKLRNIKHLKLYYDGDQNPQLGSVFSLLGLESLSLSGFRVPECAEDFPGFQQLRDLELYNVFDWNSELLERFLEKCPALQFLKLSWAGCTKPKDFTISCCSPSFLSCKIECHPHADACNRNKFCITVDTIYLRELHLTGYCRDVILQGYEDMQILRDGFVKGKWIDGNLISLEADQKMSSAFSLDNHALGNPLLNEVSGFCNLQSLKISYVRAVPDEFWNMILCLPVLESLSLLECEFLDNFEAGMESRAGISLLKRVTLKVAFYTQGLRALLNLFLENAPMLKILNLDLSGDSGQAVFWLENRMTAKFGVPERFKHSDGACSTLLYRGGASARFLQIMRNSSTSIQALLA